MAKKIRKRRTKANNAVHKKPTTNDDGQQAATIISEGCEPLDIVDLEALRETTEALSIAGCTVAEKTLVSVGESLTSAFSQGMEAVIQSTEDVLFPKLADLEDEKQKREGQSILRAEQEIMVDQMRDVEARRQKLLKEQEQEQQQQSEGALLPHQSILDEVASFITSGEEVSQKRAQSMPARTNIPPTRVFSFAGGAFNPSALVSSLGWTTKGTPPPPPEEPATPPLTPVSDTAGGHVYETLAPIYVAKPQKLQPGVSVVQQQPVKSSQSSSANNKEQDNNNLKYWRATYDYTTNKTYYFNKKTKETTWARPPGFVLTPETVKLQKKPMEQPNKKRWVLPRLKIFNR